MLIVGLGNPGKEYDSTHHNVGFMFADRVAQSYNIDFKLSKKLKCYIGEFFESGQKNYIIKPVTYMNLSGEAVLAVSSYYNIAIEDIFVVYDDMDLPLAERRIRKNGSAGGHNGIKSIIANLNTQDFKRLRIGIGRNQQENNTDVIDYVLSKFSKSELLALNDTLDLAGNIIQDLILHGIDYIMNHYNN